ncbi:MAG: CoA-acylating methylmalonate-semialdehyde dehydrogenase [Deltaproteobacteria bacterium]|nr:CoA-acylating methylmalonate-semialdehyde dehydrogenase [Deltaproteobacteria bacterium]
MDALKNFIGGEWVTSLGSDTVDVTNPATGEVIGKVPVGSKKDVDAAVAAAKSAFEGWRKTPAAQRARYLFKFRELLDANRQEIAELCTQEHGKTLAESLNDLGRGIENVEHACGMPALSMAPHLEDVAAGIDCTANRQPMGVFAAITPFNFPPMVPLWFLPYCIGTGNTMVLKTSEQVPNTWIRMMELLAETGLPAGVVNLVHGTKEVVESLCDHQDIEGVSFVGSTEVAQIVYQRASKSGKRVQALGGAKNHITIMPDAVREPSVQNATASVFGCAGQRCLAGSVVVAVGDAYHWVKTGIVEEAKKIVVGEGMNPETTMGPVISQASKDRITKMIDVGESEGAELLLDGRKTTVKGKEGGYWVGPTIFDKVKPGMRIAKEEVFGPVLCIMHAKDLEEAIEWTNSSQYANAASIFTQNGAAAREFKYQVDPAMLGVNIGVAAPMAFFPFGGSKQSFFGNTKAHGQDSVDFYTDRKVVITRYF